MCVDIGDMITVLFLSWFVCVLQESVFMWSFVMLLRRLTVLVGQAHLMLQRVFVLVRM